MRADTRDLNVPWITRLGLAENIFCEEGVIVSGRLWDAAVSFRSGKITVVMVSFRCTI